MRTISVALLVLALAQVGSSAQVRRIDGEQEPHLIPSYIAWRVFCQVVDSAYRKRVLDDYLGRRVGLADLLDGDSLLRDQFVRTIADHGTVTIREQDRLEKTRDDLLQGYQVGVRDPEYQQKTSQSWRESVHALKRARNSLRDALVETNLEIGTSLWERISYYVSNELKKNISGTSEGTPNLVILSSTGSLPSSMRSTERRDSPTRGL